MDYAQLRDHCVQNKPNILRNYVYSSQRDRERERGTEGERERERERGREGEKERGRERQIDRETEAERV